MSDDLRERKPLRDQADLPGEDGLRSDHAGTGAGVAGPAPAGGDPERIAEGPAGQPGHPTGAGKTAGGGYGTGSDIQSSGGTADGEATSGEDAQTDWLRTAEGTPPEDPRTT
jgi:hypothetical protein